MDLTKYFTLSVTHGFHVPQELEWDKLLSSIISITDVAVEGDIVELLTDRAAIRMDHPLPQSGFMDLDLFLTRVPRKPGPDGETPTGTLFSNRTAGSNAEEGWPTFRVALKRKDNLHGTLVLKVRQDLQKPWQQLVSSIPLRIYTWYNLVLSWGSALSISIAEALHDGTRSAIDNMHGPAKPSSNPEVHHFGIGKVDNPINQERPLWTEPALAGAKIRLKDDRLKACLPTRQWKGLLGTKQPGRKGIV